MCEWNGYITEGEVLRMEKAEAEVERLRAALETIKALADEDAPADYYELARAALAKEGS